MRPARCALAVCAAIALSAALVSPALARNVYVTNSGSAAVSVVDSATNAAVGDPIPVGATPNGVAITPDGTRAYVVNSGPDTVSVIDVASGTAVGLPISVGTDPVSVAITPNGARAYVSNSGSDSVSVVDTATNTVTGTPIMVGGNPQAIAITPGGTRALVANFDTSNVSVIDTAGNTVVGTIPIGGFPRGIAITPAGTRAYVTSNPPGPDFVVVVNLVNNSVLGAPIPVGGFPERIAITPDGARAFVTNGGSDNVSVISTATNTVTTTIPVGASPAGIAITADGSRAYVANSGSTTITPIDTLASTAGAPITLGTSPLGTAIVPNQPPVAAFSSTTVPRGLPAAFDAGGSSDADGTVARYDWDFGDGATLADGGPTPTHAYAAAGTYNVRLRVTDNEGCSLTQIFTGQTVYCNGSALARTRRQVTIGPPDTEPPDLNVSAPKSQRLGGAVKVSVSADEACTATADAKLVISGAGNSKSGRRSITLEQQTVQLAAAEPVTLRLKLNKRARNAASAALADERKASVRISVAAADPSGNTTSVKRTVSLRGGGGR